jgi:hypothetical protein
MHFRVRDKRIKNKCVLQYSPCWFSFKQIHYWSPISWDATLCSSVKVLRLFREKYCLHLQSPRINEARSRRQLPHQEIHIFWTSDLNIFRNHFSSLCQFYCVACFCNSCVFAVQSGKLIRIFSVVTTAVVRLKPHKAFVLKTTVLLIAVFITKVSPRLAGDFSTLEATDDIKYSTPQSVVLCCCSTLL